MQSWPVSSEPQSELIRLFSQRSGVGQLHRSPEEALTALIEATCAKHARTPEQRLQLALKRRNITVIESVEGPNPDGILEPLGSTFGEGFRMRLKKGVHGPRMRFTTAHEVCHTFFYELVPEIKFRPHGTDDTEERLCNIGAAALLIPHKTLRMRAKGLPVCLDSLERLAGDYSVSLPTMLIRLKAAGLWQCELSNWHRTSNGNFTLDRLYGGPQAPWRWLDDSPLRNAWDTGAKIFGTGMVYLENKSGLDPYKPVVYDVRRTGTGVAVLWGRGIKAAKPIYPLFARAAGSSC